MCYNSGCFYENTLTGACSKPHKIECPEYARDRDQADEEYNAYLDRQYDLSIALKNERGVV